jgi:ArsR family transcriptional regulator
MPRAAEGAGGRRASASERVGAARLDDAATVLRALSHPARLRIVSLLSGGELCVKRLEEILGMPQPSVSQHLTRLRYAGIIRAERRGHLVCYRLQDGPAAAIAVAALEAAGRTKGV